MFIMAGIFCSWYMVQLQFKLLFLPNSLFSSGYVTTATKSLSSSILVYFKQSIFILFSSKKNAEKDSCNIIVEHECQQNTDLLIFSRKQGWPQHFHYSNYCPGDYNISIVERGYVHIVVKRGDFLILYIYIWSFTYNPTGEGLQILWI